jgi:hypothetical protein
VCVRANVCIHIYNTYIQHRETSRGYVCKTLYPFHTPRILRHTRGFKWRRGMMGIPKNVCKCCTLYSLRSTKFPLWSRFPYRGKVPHTRLYNVLIKTAVVHVFMWCVERVVKTCWESPWFFPVASWNRWRKIIPKNYRNAFASVCFQHDISCLCSYTPRVRDTTSQLLRKNEFVWPKLCCQTIGKTGERAWCPPNAGDMCVENLNVRP